MSKCGYPGCTGHLGKFSSCVDEAVYEESMDAVLSTGDVDFEGFYSMVSFKDAEPVTLPDGLEVVVPAGSYIVCTASSGIVSVYRFDSEGDARKAFDVAEDRYAAWDNEEL